MTSVAVLGAGIQGCCIAVALAQKGCRVVQFERLSTCLKGASGSNEGKVHLGYVYAQDRSLQTAKTMARGALSFAPLLKRWLGDTDFLRVSDPFRYAVMRDSMLPVEELEAYFGAVSAHLNEESERDGADYFGIDVRQPIRRLSQSEMQADFDTDRVAAVFTTPEIAIDPERVAGHIGAALAAEPLIEQRFETTVEAVESDPSCPAVTFTKDDRPGRERFDHVVNTLWDSRLAIDMTAGIRPARSWTFRLKYGLRLRAHGADLQVPSTTLVAGPFGDVVNFGDGNYYLSWYPVGRLAMSSGLEPSWAAGLSDECSRKIRTETIRALSAVIHGIGGFSEERLISCRTVGGQIFAWGTTDVDDPSSELHCRYEIGVNSYGRYHSVDTGKYTMAPYFAAETVNRITGGGRWV